MLTSWSEQSTPAELSMASVLMSPPRERVLDAAELGEAEVAALADDAAAQVGTVHPQTRRWPGRRPRRSSRSTAFTYVPMPPFHNRSTGAFRISDSSATGVTASASVPSAPRTSGLSSMLLRGAWPHAAAGGDLRAVVVVPRRAGQLEQALALGPRHVRVRVRVEEDVAVVEGGHQAQRPAEQHAVAEHVA